MPILPFTAAVAPILYKSPWTEMARAYLASFGFVSPIQLANLDAPENRDIVQETLEGILVNVQREIRDISTEARDLRGVITVGRTADDTVFTTTRAVRTCVAALTRTIITAAKSTPWGFHKDVSDVVHRMVVVTLFFECLADLDNIGGYFNYQLKPRDKAPSPEAQRHDTQREESPLFMKEYEDVLGGTSESFGEGGDSTINTEAEAHGSEMTADSHALFPPAGHSLQSTAIHRREYDVPQEDEVSEDEVRVLGGSAMGMDEGAETGVVDQNKQVALPTIQAPMPVQSRNRRLVNRTTRDYEALTADFKLLSRTYKTLRRTFARRVVKCRRRELHVCQGNCFHELEEADHRNWEKGREIDSLKTSVAAMQSQIKELSIKAEENIQLKSRVQELEQQAKKGKTVRFATGRK